MPMKKWRYGCLLVIGLAAVALFVYFEPGGRLHGWLRGEAFYEGRPTSSWREIVARDLQNDPRTFFVGGCRRAPTWWERTTEWLDVPRAHRSSLDLINRKDAEPVLRELSEDDDEQIVGFASDALNPDFMNRVGMMPGWAPVTMNDDYNRWILMLDRNHRRPKR